VMVDVDECAAFEAVEARAGDTVAFEEDGGDGSCGIDVVRRGGLVDAMEVGKRGVGGRDGIGEDNVGLTAKLIEDLG